MIHFVGEIGGGRPPSLAQPEVAAERAVGVEDVHDGGRLEDKTGPPPSRGGRGKAYSSVQYAANTLFIPSATASQSSGVHHWSKEMFTQRS